MAGLPVSNGCARGRRRCDPGRRSRRIAHGPSKAYFPEVGCYGGAISYWHPLLVSSWAWFASPSRADEAVDPLGDGGDNESPSPGESARVSRRPHRRAGIFRVPVVHRVHFCVHGLRAKGTRFPAPSDFSWRKRVHATTRRGDAKVWLAVIASAAEAIHLTHKKKRSNFSAALAMTKRIEAIGLF